MKAHRKMAPRARRASGGVKARAPAVVKANARLSPCPFGWQAHARAFAPDGGFQTLAGREEFGLSARPGWPHPHGLNPCRRRR